MFLLSRTFERGTFHSTGISRFIATPGPVPLQRPLLNHSCYVAHAYSGTAAQEDLCTPGLLPYRCSTRCCLRPRGLVSHCPWRELTHGLRVGQHDQQAPKLSRSRGYVSDSGHTPFTSPTPAASSSTGRLDRPYPERLHLVEHPLPEAAVPGGWINLTQEGFSYA